MFECIHDADTESEVPTDSELLAEAGLDARAIAEVLAESGDPGE